jgi:Uncharacterized conserved protein
MQIEVFKTRIFKEREDLADFVSSYIKSVPNKSIIVVSSKLVALWRGTLAPLKEKEKLIKQESTHYLKTALCYFTIKDNMVMTNAGIDESNVKGKLLLLPKDLYKCADDLRKELKKKYKVKNLGIIISDSMILPLRSGVINAAVAYSGFKGVQNNIGKEDIYGRKLKTTLVNAADSLATAAGFLMGEAAQKTPLALIKNASVIFTEKSAKGEMKYPLKQDLYYPFLKKFFKV